MDPEKISHLPSPALSELPPFRGPKAPSPSPVHPIRAGVLDFFSQTFDGKWIAPMVLATPFFNIGKITGYALGYRMGLGSLGTRALAGGLGLIGETLVFSTAHRGLTHLLDQALSWSPTHWGQDLLSTGMTLGLLKGFHGLGEKIFGRSLGLHRLARAQQSGMARGGQKLGGYGLAYLGLVANQSLQQGLGWLPQVANPWRHSLSLFLSLNLGMALGRRATPKLLQELERDLAFKARIKRFPLDLNQYDIGFILDLPQDRISLNPSLVNAGLFQSHGFGIFILPESTAKIRMGGLHYCSRITLWDAKSRLAVDSHLPVTFKDIPQFKKDFTRLLDHLRGKGIRIENLKSHLVYGRSGRPESGPHPYPGEWVAQWLRVQGLKNLKVLKANIEGQEFEFELRTGNIWPRGRGS